jgi:hypothetical protein
MEILKRLKTSKDSIFKRRKIQILISVKDFIKKIK